MSPNKMETVNLVFWIGPRFLIYITLYILSSHTHGNNFLNAWSIPANLLHLNMWTVVIYLPSPWGIKKKVLCRVSLCGVFFFLQFFFFLIFNIFQYGIMVDTSNYCLTDELAAFSVVPWPYASTVHYKRRWRRGEAVSWKRSTEFEEHLHFNLISNGFQLKSICVTSPVIKMSAKRVTVIPKATRAKRTKLPTKWGLSYPPNIFWSSHLCITAENGVSPMTFTMIGDLWCWGCDPALRGCESALRGYERALRGYERALRGCERALRGCERALRGCERALRGCERALRGCERALREHWEAVRVHWEAMREHWEAVREHGESTERPWESTERALRGCERALREHGEAVREQWESTERLWESTERPWESTERALRGRERALREHWEAVREHWESTERLWESTERQWESTGEHNEGRDQKYTSILRQGCLWWYCLNAYLFLNGIDSFVCVCVCVCVWREFTQRWVCVCVCVCVESLLGSECGWAPHRDSPEPSAFLTVTFQRNRKVNSSVLIVPYGCMLQVQQASTEKCLADINFTRSCLIFSYFSNYGDFIDVNEIK